MQPLPPHLSPIRRWLTLCAVLVAAMVLIGGLTRLTESGLSIVEWKLVSGILPPMTQESWQAEFDAYQQTPEFRQVNRGFTLQDFQHIFWLEYIHRVLGRVIGLALILPFIWFAARRRLPKPLFRRMALACLLVAAQGTVGWIMVASGLNDQPRVAPLKLALHLSLALVLFCLLLWTRWQVSGSARGEAARPDAWRVRALLALVALQIMFGALVAGLDAGYVYNTFPLMDGRFIPTDLHFFSPWWVNHFENLRTVQFQHRIGAYLVVLGSFWLVVRLFKHADATQRHWLNALVGVVALQFALGLFTLLTVMNIALASLHQLGAVLLIGVLLRLVWHYPLSRSNKLAK